jgi:hypothetical protein
MLEWEVMDRSRDLEREVGKAENLHSLRRFSVQLPDRVAGWVDEAAARKGEAPGHFLREIITQNAEEDTESLEDQMRRLDGLIGEMSALAREIYARRDETQGR